MRITITITCDNAAFADEPMAEVGRMLAELAKKLERGESPAVDQGAKLYDINGNAVGRLDVWDR